MENGNFLLDKNKRLKAILLAVPVLLLIPFTAMIFTDEVNWSVFDYAIMGILLMGTGLMCELVIRLVQKTGYRLLIIASILLVFLLVWAELAVGIFGSPFAGS